MSRLLALMDDWRPHNGIHFNVRTVRTDVPILERNAPMADLLRELTAKGATVSEAEDYDSWGGTIAQSEVTPLGIELVDGNHLYMHGPCTKIFAEVQIKADGQVHACACRDMDGSLDIGHLDDAPLKEILSFANDPYRNSLNPRCEISLVATAGPVHPTAAYMMAVRHTSIPLSKL
ncbi:MAG: SPASM domain-containing protein [Rhodospirillales bacterium]